VHPEDFKIFKVLIKGQVAWVTIHHPPINLMDPTMRAEFNKLVPWLAEAADFKVVVFQSANPDFFIAHGDISVIGPQKSELGIGQGQAMRELLRTMAKITIAKIEGRARGGGAETALAMDMRFAARGRAILSQPEVMLGLVPPGTATARLPRLMGRSRALEILLGCEDFDADLAERYGFVNRALEPEEIGPFVENLANRIASFPTETLMLTKQAVLTAEHGVLESLQTEFAFANENHGYGHFKRRRDLYMGAGGQTREAELDLAAWAERLAEMEK
jgi:enoyl-CoA hydratase/carnithine racemase